MFTTVAYCCYYYNNMNHAQQYQVLLSEENKVKFKPNPQSDCFSVSKFTTTCSNKLS